MRWRKTPKGLNINHLQKPIMRQKYSTPPGLRPVTTHETPGCDPGLFGFNPFGVWGVSGIWRNGWAVAFIRQFSTGYGDYKQGREALHEREKGEGLKILVQFFDQLKHGCARVLF